MRKGGSLYYDYVAIRRGDKKAMTKLKLTVDYLIQRETAFYKLIPEVFRFVVEEGLAKNFVEWLRKKNRIATILKIQTNVAKDRVKE